MSLYSSFQISTQDFPVEDRTHLWMQHIRQHVIKIDCPATQIGDGITATLEQNECGLVKINRIQASAHAVQRSRSDIEDDQRQAIFLCAIIKGHGYTWQGTTCTNHVPGDLILYDTHFPYGHGFPSEMEMLVVDIPRAAIEDHVEDWRGGELIKIDRSARVAGIGSNDIQKLLTLQGLRGNQQAALSEQLISNLAVLLNARQSSSRSRPRQQLLKNCIAYIEQNLHEEYLNIDHLSKVFNTSSRQLARVFEFEKISIGRYIWNRRLERCRDDILNSPGCSLSSIAFRWGFNHSAHFSRSYKKHFGETPSDTQRAHSSLIL